MTRYYFTEDNQLREISAPQSGCWISMVAPDEQELRQLSDWYDLDMDTLLAALDTDERSRIEMDENYTMILVNIPTSEEQSKRVLYNTIPLAILMAQDVLITVCSKETPVIQAFAQGKVSNFHTQMKSRFILQFLYQIATQYLQYLRTVDKRSEAVEAQLHKSTQNRELVELLNLEKSLVYFTTSLRSNEAVLEKLLRTELIKKDPEDAELREDDITDKQQGMELWRTLSSRTSRPLRWRIFTAGFSVV